MHISLRYVTLMMSLVSFAVSTLIILEPDILRRSYVAYPIIYKNNFRNETIAGELVLPNAFNVTDRIVLVPYYRSEYLVQIRSQQERGANAVVIPAQIGGINFP